MPENGRYDYTASFEDVDAKTIGQFTGLQDVNGTDIYDGDIVRTRCYGDSFIKYEYGEWQLVGEDCRWLPLHESVNSVGISNILYELKVIGNIHDNKEFFKKKK